VLVIPFSELLRKEHFNYISPANCNSRSLAMPTDASLNMPLATVESKIRTSTRRKVVDADEAGTVNQGRKVTFFRMEVLVLTP